MNQKKHVVVVTDCKDVAFNEMKWIILSECEKMGFSDVDVELIAVEEFSIINAAFITRLIADNCIPGTVISVVINPQKNRSSRIFGKLSNGSLFFGANTGALTWLIKDFNVQDVYEIHDPGFISFGGKYVHAPNVAKLVAGVDFEKIGKPFSRELITDLSVVDGTVVHIDNFGLMKIKGQTLKCEEGDLFEIFVNGKYAIDAVFAKRMMSLDDKTWVLYCGSSMDSLPELGSVRYKEGYKDLGVKIGDVITWTRKS